MITLIPIEPLNEQHGALVVAAFNRFLIDGGGQPDGWGAGWGYADGWGDGDGWGDKIPDEWRVDESNGAPADGHKQKGQGDKMGTLRVQMWESRITEGSVPWREQEFGDARGTWQVGDPHDRGGAGVRAAAPHPDQPACTQQPRQRGAAHERR
jgi:hypothetical protein